MSKTKNAMRIHLDFIKKWFRRLAPTAALFTVAMAGCGTKTQEVAPPLTATDTSSSDPNIQAVINNPNLSQEEKAQVVNRIKSAQQGQNAHPRRTAANQG